MAHSRKTLGRAHHQRGISMLVALVSLVVLMLASLALVRSVDTGTLIVGNLGFKQDATEASAVAAEQAMSWVEGHLDDGMLDANQTDSGYYASSIDKLDPTGANTTSAHQLSLVDWDGSCLGAVAGTYTTCSTLPFTGTAVNGNQMQWVITRLCDSVGPASATNLCSRPIAIGTSTANDRGNVEAGGRISGAVSAPYYRVIIRATGPRNTVSYTETIFHY